MGIVLMSPPWDICLWVMMMRPKNLDTGLQNEHNYTLRGIKPKETSKHLLHLCYQCDCCRKKLTEQTDQQSM